MGKRKKGRLSDKQQKFITAYLIHGNASEAARQAGYAASDGNWGRCAQNIMHQKDIKRAIDEHNVKMAEKFNITRERIVEELAAIAFGHAGQVMNWTESTLKLVPRDEMDDAYEVR